jgi:hypothetical protein
MVFELGLMLARQVLFHLSHSTSSLLQVLFHFVTQTELFGSTVLCPVAGDSF